MDFGENPRLHTLLRRVTTAEREQRLAACVELQDFFQHSNDFRNVIRDPMPVFYALDEQFFARLGADVKKEVAKCIGAAGFIMGPQTADYINWIFENYENSSSDDIRGYYMQSLAATYSLDVPHHRLQHFTAQTIENITKALENVQNPQLLKPILDVATFISLSYPTLFERHFKNITDFIIGWYVDPEQTPDVHKKCEETLLKLQQFWISDPGYTIDLLGQFLEDVEAYAEDIQKSKGQQRSLERGQSPSPQKNFLLHMVTIFRASRTVISAFKDHFLTNPDSSMTSQFFNKYLTRMQLAVSGLLDSYRDGLYDVIEEAILCSATIVKVLQNNADAIQMRFTEFLSMLCFHSKLKQPRTIFLCLESIAKFVDSCSPEVLASQLPYLIGPNGILWSLRFYKDNKVQNTVLSTYRNLLKPKAAFSLQAAYKIILQELGYCLEQLAKEDCVAFENEQLSVASSTLELFLRNPYNAEFAGSVFTYLVLSLTELANTKNSVIAMWALSPGVFTLLSSVLPLTEAWFLRLYPDCVYVALETLRSHCLRHDMFLNSSDLLTSHQSGAPSTVSAPASASAKNFSVILKLLTGLLGNRWSSHDVRLLCLNWMSDIFDVVSASGAVHVFRDDDFIALFIAASDAVYAVGPSRPTALVALKKIIETVDSLPTSVFEHHISVLLHLLQHFDAKRCRFRLEMVSIDVLLSFHEDAGSRLTQEYLAKRRRLVTVGTTKSFNSANFKRLTDFVLYAIPLTADKNDGGYLELWKSALERVYFSCGHVNTHAAEHESNLPIGFLWFWAIWQVAHHTVDNRLKTTLGKAQDTFMAIEAAIRMFANEAVNNVEASKSSISGKVSPLLPWFRVRLLLNFMEQLDKLIYCACEGTAMALAQPPKSVKAFFRTNKNTCRDWLNRIRLQMMVVALNNQQYPMVIRLAWQAFNDLQYEGAKTSINIDLLVLLTAQALQHCGASYSLQGLYMWCKSILKIKSRWLKALADKSIGRYELSAERLSSELFSWLSRETAAKDSGDEGLAEDTDKKETVLEPPVVHHIINEVLDSYIKLNDYRAALNWIDTVNELKNDQSTDYQKAFQLNYGEHYLKALSNFEDNNVSDAKADFELVPKVFGPRLAWSQNDLHNYVDYRLLEAVLVPPARESNERFESQSGLVELTQLLHNSEFMQISGSFPPSLSIVNQTKLKCIYVIENCQGKSKTPLELHQFVSPASVHVERVDVLNNLLYWIRAACRGSFKETGATIENGSIPQSKTTASLKHALLIGSIVERKHRNFKHSEFLLREFFSITAVQNNNKQLVHEEPKPKLCDVVLSPNVITVLSPVRNLQLAVHASKLLSLSKRPAEGFELLCDSITRTLEDFHLQMAPLLRSGGLSGDARILDVVVNALAQPTLYPSGSPLMSSRKIGGHNSSLSPSREQVLSDMHELPRTLGKSLNRLAIWMQAGDSLELGEVLLKNEESLFIKLLEEQLEVAEGALDSNSVVGSLLRMSVNICPTLAKNQAALGNWAYKSGRKSIDGSKDDKLTLTVDETQFVETVLTQIDVDAATKETVLSLLTNLPGDGLCETLPSTDVFRTALVEACPALGPSETVVGQLTSVWLTAQSRLFKQYEVAANAYFAYLRMSDINKKDSTAITATLRLLRLLVKYSKELLPVLEPGFPITPVDLWKNIIPQLFARLNHPVPAVRSIISQLLCRLAEQSPELIVFPAVVGFVADVARGGGGSAAEGIFLETETEMEGADTNLDELTTSTEENVLEDSVMKTCYGQIVDALSKDNADLVVQVKLAMHELQRITLLRDEMWLTVLSLLQHEVDRRLEQLKKEIEKTESNSSLDEQTKQFIIKEKNDVFMNMIYKVLEDLHAKTSAAAETPNEKSFVENYSQAIGHALELAKSSHSQKQAWEPFRQLLNGLMQKANKRSSLQLDMTEISPVLSGLKATLIPMPGITCSAGSPVTLCAVQNLVSILPTKTKPKKLSFLGSDGRKYSYLFKGLEDLHLDERIMQFLEICNAMFIRIKAHSSELSPYYARHYSVTPLGPRSGLIQWVEGAIPFFSLYKRWQMREAALIPGMASCPRPSELFYSKLTPALEARGIRDLENRSEWPASVLRDVLQDLISETPRDLLQKEMWCLSTDPTEWWNVTRRFSQSCAVMSVIGYVIGLGDRHLDNLLIDLHAGEGRYLRVPERVPFRMTQNVQSALGPFGIEGIFRLASEEVLKTLRSERETLLTLLEAFVYDPLVDWTATHEGGVTGLIGSNVLFVVHGCYRVDEYKKLAMDSAMRMFEVRLKEVEKFWMDNRKLLTVALGNLTDFLNKGIEAQDSYQTSLDNLDSLEKQTALIDEALADSNHSLYTLAERFRQSSALRSQLSIVSGDLSIKFESCEEWCALYRKAFGALQELGALRSALADVNSMNISAHEVAAEFLHSAGKTEKIVQCKEAEAELRRTLLDNTRCLSQCIDLLESYASIQKCVPLQKFVGHRLYQWHELLGEALALRPSEPRNQYPSPMKSPVPTGPDGGPVDAQQAVALFGSKVARFLATRSLQQPIPTLVTWETGVELRQCLAQVSGLAFFIHSKQPSAPEFVESVLDDTRTRLISEATSSCAGVSTVFAEIIRWLVTSTRELIGLEQSTAEMTHETNSKHVFETTGFKTGFGWCAFVYRATLLSNTLASYVQIAKEIIPSKNADNSNSEAMSELLALSVQLQAAVGSIKDLFLVLSASLPRVLKSAVSGAPEFVHTVAGFDHLLSEVGYDIREMNEQMQAMLLGQGRNEPLLMSLKVIEKQYRQFVTDVSAMSGAVSVVSVFLADISLKFQCVCQQWAELVRLVSKLSFNRWIQYDLVQELSATQSPFVEVHTYAHEMMFLLEFSTVYQAMSYGQQFSSKFNGEAASVSSVLDILFVFPQTVVATVLKQSFFGCPSMIFCNAAFVLLELFQQPNKLVNGFAHEESAAEKKLSVNETIEELLTADDTSRWNAPRALVDQLVAAQTDLHYVRFSTDLNLLLASMTSDCQSMLIAHQWCNEQSLNAMGKSVILQPSRSQLLQRMSEVRAAIKAVLSSVTPAHEKLTSVESTVLKQLKWAVGANPNLADTLAGFEHSIAMRHEHIENLKLLCNQLTDIFSALCHFENLAEDTNETLGSDRELCEALQRYLVTVNQMAEQKNSLGPLEHLLEIANPVNATTTIDSHWLTQTRDILRQSYASAKHVVEQGGALLEKLTSALHESTHEVRTALAGHHKIILEVRSVLKALAKFEESEKHTGFRFCQYIALYKLFSEQMACCIRVAGSASLLEDDVRGLVQKLALVSSTVDGIYDLLLSLQSIVPSLDSASNVADTELNAKCEDLKNLLVSCAAADLQVFEEANTENRGGSAALPRAKSAAELSALNVVNAGAVGTNLQKKPAKLVGAGGQERNAHALSIWRRVKMKLEGRDPDTTKKSSVTEQVNFIIRDATSIENLSQMYEGWTAWV